MIFKSDLSSDRDVSEKNKSQTDAATPTGNVIGKPTPKSSTSSIVAGDRRITRRTSISNAIDQSPQSSARKLRKRKVIELN